MNTSKKTSKKAGLLILAVSGTMMLLASCGGHKLCEAYGGKTNTNTETIQE